MPTSLVAIASKQAMATFSLRAGFIGVRAASTRPAVFLAPAAATPRILPRQPAFSTSSNQQLATPVASSPRGVLPQGFRVGHRPTWDQGESAMDKAGRYFLLMEMMRGMYVCLEQFFRAP